jgi:hypothetical protein
MRGVERFGGDGVGNGRAEIERCETCPGRDHERGDAESEEDARSRWPPGATLEREPHGEWHCDEKALGTQESDATGDQNGECSAAVLQRDADADDSCAVERRLHPDAHGERVAVDETEDGDGEDTGPQVAETSEEQEIERADGENGERLKRGCEPTNGKSDDAPRGEDEGVERRGSSEDALSLIVDESVTGGDVLGVAERDERVVVGDGRWNDKAEIGDEQERKRAHRDDPLGATRRGGGGLGSRRGDFVIHSTVPSSERPTGIVAPGITKSRTTGTWSEASVESSASRPAAESSAGDMSGVQRMKFLAAVTTLSV